MKVMLTDAGQGKTQGRATCAARALALAMGWEFDTACSVLFSKTNFGLNTGVSVYSLNALLKSMGWEFVAKRVRLNDTAEQRLPQRAILLFRDHVAYYMDSTIYDGFNTNQYKGYKQTQGYWVPKNLVEHKEAVAIKWFVD
jgi:cyanate permease